MQDARTKSGAEPLFFDAGDHHPVIACHEKERIGTPVHDERLAIPGRQMRNWRWADACGLPLQTRSLKQYFAICRDIDIPHMEFAETRRKNQDRGTTKTKGIARPIA